MQKRSKLLLQALGVGVLAGIRSMSAPFIVNRMLNKHKLTNPSFKIVQSDRAYKNLRFLAAGEMMADKLPFAPDRIHPIGLIARCISGGVASVAIFKANKCNLIVGGLIGCIASLGASYASFYIRKNIHKKTNIYDPLLGVVEDSLVIGSGIALVTSA